MTRPPDLEPLLDDVLAPEDGRKRAASLARTLAAVRARRARRRAGSAAIAVAVLLAAGLMFVRGPRGNPRGTKVAVKPVLKVLTSRPLAPGQLLRSRMASVQFIQTRPVAFAVVSTADSPVRVLEIDDQRLLALASDRPAALVRPVGERARLLFLDDVQAESPVENLH